VVIFNKLKSKRLLLRASACQGRRQFQEVVDLSREALELDPEATTAFLLLAGAHSRLRNHEEAKSTLAQALKLYPDHEQFNYMMAEAIIDNREPVDNAIPFLKAYLQHASQSWAGFPWWMRFVFRRLGVNPEEYAERLENSASEKYKLASDIVAEYEKNMRD
jgi:tetratricopeptide (TPR) repeat protein